MINLRSLPLVSATVVVLLSGIAHATPPTIPDPLKPWVDWALWNDDTRDCPTPFNDARKPLCTWPMQLTLSADATSGRFDFGVTVYAEAWVSLPGGLEAWPVEVTVDGAPVPVLPRDNTPSVKLGPGTHKITGLFRWSTIPQRIPIPPAIGILNLTVDGNPIANPSWDDSGTLWLTRRATDEGTEKNFLQTKVYAVLEDGIPLWLRTDIELIVSGKSREEEIGTILPEGWKLASVQSQIPAAIDENGNLKAQVRAGRWIIRTTAFRIDNLTELRFAAGAKPAVTDELIAFRAKPDFRLVDIVGPVQVDVSQTTFPGEWRELPVYRWDTSAPVKIEERLRGMGLQNPAGINISREWWLEESGKQFTFRDRIGGTMQMIWRLDVAEGQDLGSVRSSGEGQLITRNPADGAAGVEVRTRNIDLEATGRMPASQELPATGWRADAGSLNVTLNLPPGWRLYGLLGADWVRGDWLTAWTLLDLFVLLIFSLAVSKIAGPLPAVLAFVALALSYHEPGAPRFVWLALLVPIALLRVVKAGAGHRFVTIWKWLTVVVLVFLLAPFVTTQVQQALYPQLERVQSAVPHATAMPVSETVSSPENFAMGMDSAGYVAKARPRAAAEQMADKSNLAFDPKARIQTGPGVPDWTWRTVTFGWNGPVLASQTVHPILIPMPLERVLTVLRVLLLLALTGILLDARRWRLPAISKTTGMAAAALALILTAPTARAQFPEQAMIDTLRERLLEANDAYPNAAEIPLASLQIANGKITIEADIQTALQTAVPLPGRLPAWSPVSVSIDGKPASALRRADGFLWVVVPAGIHRVRVEGLLPDVPEWEWSFALKPRYVTVEAPDWTVSGIRPNGMPEAQVFFARKQKTSGAEATYDRQALDSLLVVDRRIELGLVWQVRTSVSRLSPPGRAVAARIPILPGENVLSQNITVRDGAIDVRLGANENAFSWVSELPATGSLELTTKPADSWIERWYLVASPVWNVAISGLSPIFEPADPELVPVWHPWPGESASLTVTRPEAIAGSTITVSRATHEVTLGNRQRTSRLDLSLRCSLGEDFMIGLPAGAEVTALTHDGRAIPVRMENDHLIIPVRPGEQTIHVEWSNNQPLGFQAATGAVSLPVASANVQTIIRVPDNRWVLWTHGPLRGPAVRFWTVLVCSLLAAFALGRLGVSRLRTGEWMLLALGLTQVPLAAALTVVAWLIFLEWRGSGAFQKLTAFSYNLLQIVLIALTACSLSIFIAITAAGLLGDPDMFISGNNSTRSQLQWYAAESGLQLPTPGCFSVSIWWYRFLMLVWALWLAASLIRWLQWGWKQFSTDGCFRGKKKTTPPELPTA